jgi:membrane protein required for colicin V production
MNTADYLIVAVLALSMLFGLLRGFVSTVLSLSCWIAAVWVAWAFGAQVAVFYGSFLGGPAARLMAGYLTCFIGVLVVGAVIGWLVRKLLDRGGLRGGDRLLGLLFGLARGLLLVTFAVLVLGSTGLPQEAGWWRQSLLLPSFEGSASWFSARLPAGATRYLEIGGKSLPELSKAPISVVPDPAVQRASSSAVRAPGHGPIHGGVGQ